MQNNKYPESHLDLHTQRHIFAMIGELSELTNQTKEEIHEKIHLMYGQKGENGEKIPLESCHELTSHQIWDLKQKLRMRIHEEQGLIPKPHYRDSP